MAPPCGKPIRPWVSSRNIGPGSRWNPSLASQLEGARVGILCLTQDALNSQWLIFEAGALSKTLGSDTLVCPYLFELHVSSISGPLTQFQATRKPMQRKQRGYCIGSMRRWEKRPSQILN